MESRAPTPRDRRRSTQLLRKHIPMKSTAAKLSALIAVTLAVVLSVSTTAQQPLKPLKKKPEVP
jgi:ABC-type proline/glycine betaine transport system permease subunit